MNSELVGLIIQTDSRIREKEDFWNHGQSERGRIYSFLNPVSYLNALKNKEMFCQMDGLFADGSLLVAAIKLCYGVKITRYSFDMTSLAPKILSYAAERGKTVYIVGSKEEEVEHAVAIISEQYKGIDIVGYRNGYFVNEEEKDKEARHIAELNPDFVIVGMKSIMQEQFLIKVKKAGFCGMGFTCGGFISQISKFGLVYYPAWMDRENLRFVYRLWKEPHTRMRYVIAGIAFPIYFVRERFFG